jgi:uncharacterized membrane protein
MEVDRMRHVLGALSCLAMLAPAATWGQGMAPPSDAEILALVKTHCAPCHATEPTHPAFAKPPAGIILENIEQVARHASRIMTQVVIERAMPLGNETEMTDAERARVGAWIAGRK